MAEHILAMVVRLATKAVITQMVKETAGHPGKASGLSDEDAALVQFLEAEQSAPA